MEFEHHDILSIIAIFAVFGLLYGLWYRRAKRLATNYKLPFRRFWIKLPIRLAIVSLLSLAWASPYTEKPLKAESKTKTLKDVYFLVDISASMNCQDLAPSRLERSKFEIIQHLEGLQNCRLGLIPFSSQAFVFCPLTEDKQAFNAYLQNLDQSQTTASGSNLSAALQLVLSKFETNKQSTQVAILISDGEDFGKDTKKLARRLRKENILLITVATGSKAGGPIPLADGKVKTIQGKNIISKSETTYLKKITELANGRYFELSPEQNDLSKMVNAIKSEQGTATLKSSKLHSQRRYFFPYLLLAAVLLICLDILLPVRLFKI